MNALHDVIEPGEPQRLGTGYAFSEGPLWDPQGFFYFADVRSDLLYRVVPGQAPEVVRHTENGNGTTFDLAGNVIQCEGDMRRLTRWNPATGHADIFVDNSGDGRFNRPNDAVCRSDGSIYFTDPSLRMPIREREIDAAVWRVFPDGRVKQVAQCEYPNGLAFSADERKLYVANTRTLKYLQVFELDDQGEFVSRRIFSDMSAHNEPGVPDGVKVDVLGRVYCTGPGGIWAHEPDGTVLGIIRCPETPVNFCFGGEDLRTLFVCAHSSIYTLRMVRPGLPQPWYGQAGAPRPKGAGQ